MIITENQLNLFLSMFRGRQDVYARYWEKDNRSGWSPAYEFDWTEFMEFKKQGGTLKTFQNKRLKAITPNVIKEHLVGEHTMGVYPILHDNTSYFIAADFDGENWLSDSKVFVSICHNYGVDAYLERSRSGNGGHAWIFFETPYPCIKSRLVVLEFIRQSLRLSEFDKEVTFDRLFPNQDVLPILANTLEHRKSKENKLL